MASNCSLFGRARALASRAVRRRRRHQTLYELEGSRVRYSADASRESRGARARAHSMKRPVAALWVRFFNVRIATGQGLKGHPVRNAHILPCPRLMVWRITGAVT